MSSCIEGGWVGVLEFENILQPAVSHAATWACPWVPVPFPPHELSCLDRISDQLFGCWSKLLACTTGPL